MPSLSHLEHLEHRYELAAVRLAYLVVLLKSLLSIATAMEMLLEQHDFRS